MSPTCLTNVVKNIMGQPLDPKKSTINNQKAKAARRMAKVWRQLPEEDGNTTTAMTMATSTGMRTVTETLMATAMAMVIVTATAMATATATAMAAVTATAMTTSRATGTANAVAVAMAKDTSEG